MQFCHYCPWTLNFTVEMFHLPVCMTMHANCTSNSFLQPNECVGFTDLQAFLFACAAFVFCLRTSPSRWPVFLMIWPSVPACSRASICIESRTPRYLRMSRVNRTQFVPRRQTRTLDEEHCHHYNPCADTILASVFIGQLFRNCATKLCSCKRVRIVYRPFVFGDTIEL